MSFKIWFLIADISLTGAISLYFPENVVFWLTEFARYLLKDLAFELPFSRNMEREADKIGAWLHKRAGFDPGASARVWQKMLEYEGNELSEFFSTHPSHKNRLDDLKKLVPVLQHQHFVDESGVVHL